jgi:hypothetical protein
MAFKSVTTGYFDKKFSKLTNKNEKLLATLDITVEDFARFVVTEGKHK